MSEISVATRWSVWKVSGDLRLRYILPRRECQLFLFFLIGDFDACGGLSCSKHGIEPHFEAQARLDV